MLVIVFFFKQKTAYEVRISDWSSDVCSSDLDLPDVADVIDPFATEQELADSRQQLEDGRAQLDAGRAQAESGQQQIDAGRAQLDAAQAQPIGRASCRERVGQYV